MSEEIKIIEEKDFDEALAQVPDEVQDFMWSDAFEYILDISQKTIPLNDEEKKSMRRAAYALLIRLKNMGEIAKEMLAEKIDPEKITKILYIIDTQILTIVKGLMKHDDQTTEQDSGTEESSPAPSPSDMLARLNQTMTAPSTLAPTKRVYATEATTPTPPSNPPAPTGIKSIDPYREMPDAN